MPTRPRRFGAFHRYPQTDPPRRFTPDERDELLLESITPELSPLTSDNYVEMELSRAVDDKSGEMGANGLTPFGKDFHKDCGKPCGKLAF